MFLAVVDLVVLPSVNVVLIYVSSVDGLVLH
jgi:hypothetical protein